MKELTPIQKIIEFIDESAGQMPLEGVLEYAKYLLKEEKQAIIDSYTTAQKEMIDILHEYLPINKTFNEISKVLSGDEKNEDAETYFNNKYNTK